MKLATIATALLSAATASFSASAQDVQLNTRDAERFAELLFSAPGAPTAESLQLNYFSRASAGLNLYASETGVNASAVADAILADQSAYDTAVDRCLPAAQAGIEGLDEVVSAYHTIANAPDDVRIYAVIGDDEARGAAADGVVVIALERACGRRGDAGARLRRAIALQLAVAASDFPDRPVTALEWALRRGAVLLAAERMLGAPVAPRLDERMAPREAENWRLHQNVIAGPFMRPEGRWFAPLINAPDGWPRNASVWLGLQIVRDFVAARGGGDDALRAALRLDDGAAFLAASGYAAQYSGAAPLAVIE